MNKYQSDELTKEKAGALPPRYWLGRTFERNLIFLNDEGESFNEHRLYFVSGRVQFPCLKQISEECPACALGLTPSRSTLFSVLDLGRSGNKPVTEIRKGLFSASSYVSRQLAVLRVRHKTLIGKNLRFEGAEDPNCHKIEVVGDIHLANFRDVTPYATEEVCRFKSRHEIESLLAKMEVEKRDGIYSSLGRRSVTINGKKDTLITVPEMARELKLSEGSVYGLLRSNVIPNRKPGGRFLVDRAEFACWKTQHFPHMAVLGMNEQAEERLEQRSQTLTVVSRCS